MPSRQNYNHLLPYKSIPQRVRPRYCVFWIPCIVHGEIKVLDGKNALPSIQVKSTDGKVFVIKPYANNVTERQINGKIQKQVTINVQITEQGDSNPEAHYKFSVKLTSVECRGNGLIEFEYTIPDKDYMLFKDIRDSIYKLIKEHFHQHRHHDYYEGIVEGYYPDAYIPLEKYDNEALKFYLRQIYRIVKVQLQQVEYDYEELIKNVGIESDNIKKARNDFYKGCEDIFGQFVFYNSLLNSKWNVSCRKEPIISNPDEDLRRIAHNIYNILERLRVLYRKSRSVFYINKINENAETQKRLKDLATSNNETLKASKTSNAISLGLGILSIILGGVSIWQGCSNRNLEKQVDILATKVDSLSNTKTTPAVQIPEVRNTTEDNTNRATHSQNRREKGIQ